jgi:hypothetical protein
LPVDFTGWISLLMLCQSFSVQSFFVNHSLLTIPC